MSTSMSHQPTKPSNHSGLQTSLIDLSLIDPLPGSRPLDSEAVGNLAESIRDYGMFHPPTLIQSKDRYFAVDGMHRCAATQLNGDTHVEAFVLPEGTETKSLRVRSLQANHVRKDESFADVLARVEGLMEERQCNLREATNIAKIKKAYASKLIKVVDGLSPEAMAMVKSTPSLGLTIPYYIAKQTSDSETQLHWLRENVAGRMSRADIIAQGSPSSEKAGKRVSLELAIDDVVFHVTMPGTIAYDQLRKCIGKLKQRFSEQEKLNHPVDLLPRLMAEASP